MLKTRIERFIKLILLAIILPVVTLFYSFRSVSGVDQYAVKAMFVYNFTKYFDWSQISTRPDFVIAVCGNSNITKYLTEIADRKNINGKKIIIKNISSVAEAAGAQMIYMPEDAISLIPEITGNQHLRNIIIISESKNAIKKGAHINLINIDGKMRFELNETGLKNDEIHYSKDLSQLAIKIY